MVFTMNPTKTISRLITFYQEHYSSYKLKEKGLEEVNASNILELGVKLNEDDFYPVDGNEDLLEYSMVKGVYLYTDICNAEPDEDMVEDTVREYLENIKDCLVDRCEDQARDLLKLNRDQKTKSAFYKLRKYGDLWNVENEGSSKSSMTYQGALCSLHTLSEL